MSDSGIFTLPQGWAVSKLYCLLETTENVDPRRRANIEFDYVDIEAVDNVSQRIISPKRILASNAPSRARKLLASGDVIFSLVRPYLKNIAIVGDELNEAIASTAFFVCRPIRDLNSKFLFNFLRQDSFVESITTYGDSPPAGHDDEFVQLTIPVAPVREQERIVDALDELFSDLDSGLEALRSAHGKLAQYRASVLKAALQGDLTVGWREEHPDVEPASLLLQRILKERRQRWEEEQLRKFKANDKTPPANWKSKYNEPIVPDTTKLPALPAGWCWTSFGQCFDVRVGATPSRNEARYWNGDIPWVASGEVQFCRINKTRETISRDGLKNTSTQINPAGSVLLNMIGEGKTRGKAGLLDIDACNNQNCAAIWVSETSIPSLYIYYWLLYQYEQTRQLGSGNNQPAMNGTIVKSILFPLAPLDELVAIVETIDSQMSVVEHLNADLVAKNEFAKALQQSLLRHAFTGQLVAQDESEEPATELLNRIAAEREARSKAAPKRNSARKPATSKRRKQTR